LSKDNLPVPTGATYRNVEPLKRKLERIVSARGRRKNNAVYHQPAGAGQAAVGSNSEVPVGHDDVRGNVAVKITARAR
jgi:hypothetical protein